MEINVGDYVRTKDGYIDQVESINEKDMCGEYPRPSVWLSKCFVNLFIDEIKKHSKDIIDLVEVGDYVNGWLVYEVQITENDTERTFVSVDECYDNYCGFIHNNEIKSVLTKEQFETNAYTIEKER